MFRSRFSLQFQPDTSGTLSGSSVTARVQTIGAVDSNSKTVPIQTSNPSGSTLTLSSSSATASNLSASLGSAVVNNNSIVTYNASFNFALTAANQTLYVSANPAIFVPNSVTGGAVGNLPIAGMMANPGQISGEHEYLGFERLLCHPGWLIPSVHVQRCSYGHRLKQ